MSAVMEPFRPPQPVHSCATGAPIKGAVLCTPLPAAPTPPANKTRRGNCLTGRKGAFIGKFYPREAQAAHKNVWMPVDNSLSP